MKKIVYISNIFFKLFVFSIFALNFSLSNCMKPKIDPAEDIKKEDIKKISQSFSILSLFSEQDEFPVVVGNNAKKMPSKEMLLPALIEILLSDMKEKLLAVYSLAGIQQKQSDPFLQKGKESTFYEFFVNGKLESFDAHCKDNLCHLRALFLILIKSGIIDAAIMKSFGLDEEIFQYFLFACRAVGKKIYVDVSGKIGNNDNKIAVYDKVHFMHVLLSGEPYNPDFLKDVKPSVKNDYTDKREQPQMQFKDLRPSFLCTYF